MRSARAAVLALLVVGCAMDREQPGGGAAPLGSELLAHFRIDHPAGVVAHDEDAPPSADGTSADASRSGAAPARPAARRPSSSPLVVGTDVAVTAGSLRLEDVLRSVELNFPLVLAAAQEVEIASGKAESAAGAFDTKLKSKNTFELEGYYESDRLDVWLEQPTTLWGTSFEAGWRRGDGSFAVYDGKAKTNTDGEFRVGANLPLLQGRRIDPKRVKLAQSAIEQRLADPRILEKRLAATRKAAESYWKWLAWGEKTRISQRLLSLAETRQDQVATAVREGELAEINLLDNERLIVDRRAKWEAARQGLRRAAIELSLYWRDETGEPLVPSEGALPTALPTPRALEAILVLDDESLAVGRRPELLQLRLELERLRLERDLASNEMLPSMDVGVFASQDEGRAVNTPDDKDDFELAAVLRFDLPLQRRTARGARRVADAKIAKLEHEARFMESLVVSEVRDAVAVIEQTLRRLTQAERNVDLARQLEEAERLQLRLGESDLFRVNLREQQSAVAAASLVDVLAEHFVALVGYRAVLGVPYDEVLAGQSLGRAAPE